ncbi:siderophore-interacting protein [Nocardioides faecalis]|uniref:siderophore-interacting protein n=1 Tax=Nocardioides faecalis TaxID=2803858 RepID=UPI0020BE6DDD|nr:siderophore-interacting protein [Nocardioides faecalis]
MTTSEKPAKPAKPLTELTVLARHRVSPSMVRLDLGGDLSAFAGSAFTDRYVKLVFPEAGQDAASALAAGARPTLRTYTALDPDVAAGTLSIDFVVHGDEGVAGTWAAKAQPGDTITVRGPGGAYAPDPDADWHLFAGDEAAIPAIRQSLADLAAKAPYARGHVVVQVDGPAHEQDLPAPEGVEVTWLHRTAPTHPDLATAVRALPWPEGRVHAFVHGEGEAVMKGVRPYLLRERAVPRDDVSISAYWRRGRTEEAFREWKAELARTETQEVPT